MILDTTGNVAVMVRYQGKVSVFRATVPLGNGCTQYLAPIIKNRQYNYPPLGINPFAGAVARPNEITYSEDWLRPDYVPPPGPPPPGPRPRASH